MQNGAQKTTASDAVFSMIDRNSDGMISRAEWQQAMQNGRGARSISAGAEVDGEDLDVTNIPSPAAALRPGQKKKFPPSWGVPPLMQTRDYVVWPEGYGAGSSTIAEWISDNLRKDVAQREAHSSPHRHYMHQGPEAAAGGTRSPVPHLAASPTTPSASASVACAAAAAAVASASATAASVATVPHRDWAYPGRLQMPSSQPMPRTPRSEGAPTPSPAVGGQAVGRTSYPGQGSRPLSPAGIWRQQRMESQALALNQSTDTTVTQHRNLTASIESELRTRTQEVAGQTAKLERAIESARKARVSEAVTTRSASLNSGRAVNVEEHRSQGLAARMGAATARKVAEIERLLLEELEQTLVRKTGFIASCLHGWRREASLQRASAKWEEELHRSQTSFRRHLALRENALMLEYQTIADRRKERVRQQYETMMDTWRRGDRQGLLRLVLHMWLSCHAKEKRARMEKRQCKAFGSVLSKLAQNQALGLTTLSFRAWQEVLSQARALEGHQRVVERAGMQFLDDKGRNFLQACWTAWARRARATDGVLSKLAKGTTRGLLAASMRGWSDTWRLAKSGRRSQEAIKKMGQRWMVQQAMGVARSAFRAWVHELRTIGEKKRLQDYMDGERMKREEGEAEKRRIKENEKESRHQAVQMVLRKWELGSKKAIVMQVFLAWNQRTKAQAALHRQKQGVHSVTQRWILGKTRGLTHSCFSSWREEMRSEKRIREQDAKLREEAESLRSMMVDERGHFEARMRHHLTEAEKQTEKLNKALGMSLSRALLGEEVGIVTETFRVWMTATDAQRKIAAKKQAVHMALAQSIAGQERGLLQATYLNWRMHTREMRQDAMAHAAMTVAVHKWLQGNVKGLLSTVLLEWRNFVAERKKQNSVHVALMKGIAGEAFALKKECFVGWISVLHLAKAVSEANVGKDRELEKRKLQDKERREHLAKVTAIMGDSGSGSQIFLATVFSSWRSHTSGVLASQWERKLIQQTEDQLREQKLLKTKQREQSLKALERLGLQDGRVVVGECFLAWSRTVQQIRLEQRHLIEHNATLTRMGDFIALNKIKQETHQLMATILWEFLKAVRIERREHYDMQVQGRFEEANAWVEQLEQQRANLEEQLWLAYKQIDHITDTLQKELKTKEELAAELREAYDKMRRQTFSIGPSPTTPPLTSPSLLHSATDFRSRPGSASSRTRSTGAQQRTHVSVEAPVPSPPSLMWQESYSESLSRTAPAVVHDASSRIDFASQDMIYDGRGAVVGDRLADSGSCTWNDAVTGMERKGLLKSMDGIL